MIALVVAFTVSLAFAVWRDALPLLERVVAVLERKYPAVPQALDEPAYDKLPADIEQLAKSESEEWARDAVRERAWELYRTTHNWDEAKQILFAERQITLFGGELDNGVN